MENELKYRVRAKTCSTWDDKPYLEYVVQQKYFGLFWITVTESSNDKTKMERMCDELNNINK
jgi:hypothetical protein